MVKPYSSYKDYIHTCSEEKMENEHLMNDITLSLLRQNEEKEEFDFNLRLKNEKYPIPLTRTLSSPIPVPQEERKETWCDLTARIYLQYEGMSYNYPWIKVLTFIHKHLGYVKGGSYMKKGPNDQHIDAEISLFVDIELKSLREYIQKCTKCRTRIVWCNVLDD